MSRFAQLGSNSRVNNLNAKLDAWILPFFNVYAIAGYIWNRSETTVDVSLPPLLPGGAERQHRVTIPTYIEGSVAGLGLTLARAIVRRLGGEIEAASGGPGEGAEFTVRLPLVDAPQPAEAPAADAASTERRRVLVVDDNVDAAQTLAQYLRLTGHRVESALDGEAALRIAEVLHPDVAFIDLNMPRMDGTEVPRRLRLTPWGRRARRRLVA